MGAEDKADKGEKGEKQEWKEYGDDEWKDWKKDDYYSKKKDHKDGGKKDHGNKKQYADKGDWKDWDSKDDKYPKAGTGTVIEVPDGSTIVLNLAGFIPKTTSGVDLVSRKIGIAGCVAPRVCSKSGTDKEGYPQKDQHYAWESREYLRNWLLGKKVQYKFMYAKGEGQRWMEYCEVRFDNQDVASQLVYECVCKFVNTDDTRKGYGNTKAEDLEATGIALNELKYGIYDHKARTNEDNMRTDVQYLNAGDSDGKLVEFMEANAGQFRECIVEAVPDAGSYRVCILPRDGYKWDSYVYMNVTLSGLVAPGFVKDEYFKEKEASKGSSLKARDWVVQRLMNKNMQIRLEKVEKVPMPAQNSGLPKGKGKGKKMDSLKNKHAPGEMNPQFFKREQIFATLKHPSKGSIADFILEEGFGVFLKHTAAYSESGLQSLSDAEAKAKEDKQGRWKNFDPEEDERKLKKIQEEIAAEFFEFRGQVVEVVAGDQFKVINIETREEKRFYLANCTTKLDNQPAYGSIKNRDQTDTAAVKADDWSYATNEFFRKKLVGRTVTVKLEYKRHISYYLKQLKRRKWDDEEAKEDKEGAAQAFTLDEITGKKAKKEEKPEERREATPLPSDEASGELYFVTLLDDKRNNVAVKGIEEGLLYVEKQRDEYCRSRHYDELQDAYKKTLSEKKGKFDEAAPAPDAPRYTELILQPASGGSGQAGRPRGPQTKKELSELAMAYENQLKGKEHSGIITYVLSGSRYRLKLPYEKLLVNFQMSGVRAPNPARGGKGGGKGASKGEGKGEGSFRGEPFGDDALQLAREQILQQDVKVMIERVDPNGTFMGTLYTTSKDGRTKKNDLGKELLSRGFGWTDEYCYNNDYKVVEAAAKENKLGSWSIERVAPKKQKEEHDELAIGEMFQGSISYVTAVDDFYVIPDQDEAEEVQNKINEIEEYCKLVEKPRKSEIYIVQDYEDKKWYRATYEGHGSEGFTMKFVDTGAIAEVESDAVKQIPKGHELNNTPYAAVNCQLYGVKSVEDTWEQSGEALFKLTNKQDIMGVVEYRTGGRARDGPGSLKMKVTLMMGKKLVQEELLKEGVVRLKLRENQPGGGRVDIKTWKDAQEKAKRARVNMWRMGDPGDSDEEDRRY